MKEIPEGEEDKVIPQKSSHVNLNEKYIYEFNRTGKEDGRYSHPGFISSSKHQFKMNYPCCFKTINETQKNIRLEMEKQMGEFYKDVPSVLEFKQDGKKKKKVDKPEYIVLGNKFPLEYKRFGQLPLSLEGFFNFDNKTCYKSVKTQKFKLDTPCLMRYGTDQHETKSFLSCLSMLFLKDNKHSYMDIIEKIEEKVSIDDIFRYHNGTITKTFNDDSEISDEQISKYKHTKVYRRFIKRDKAFLKRHICGYEQFFQYLKDEQEIIDYTYLWDIICSGVLNEYAQGNRINLMILSENNDDITNNISIVCPTTTHSKYILNHRFDTILLYKKGITYEPIVIRNETKKNIQLIKMFNKKNTPKPIFSVLKTTLMNISKSCESTIVNQNYGFRKNIQFREIVDKYLETFKANQMTILTQILNFDGSTIGFIIKDLEIDGEYYIPCAPSPMNKHFNYEYITDKYWSSYTITKEALLKIYELSDSAIACKPVIKVVDKEMIVGIITNGNQFIMINEPEPNMNHNDDLITKNIENPYLADKELFQERGEFDRDRRDTMLKIKLERNFYKAYYDTMKININDSSKEGIKSSIIHIIQNDSLDFFEKFGKLIEILYNMENEFVHFTDYSQDILDNLEEIAVCDNENEDEYCLLVQGTKKIMIPRLNLYTNESNEKAYLYRFVEDLLRKNNVHHDIFKSKSSYIDSYIQYSILPNEILILETAMQNKYLANTSLHKNVKSKYVKHSSYDDMDPQDVLDIIDFRNYQNRERNGQNSPNEASNEEMMQSLSTMTNETSIIENQDIEPEVREVEEIEEESENHQPEPEVREVEEIEEESENHQPEPEVREIEEIEEETKVESPENQQGTNEKNVEENTNEIMTQNDEEGKENEMPKLETIMETSETNETNNLVEEERNTQEKRNTEQINQPVQEIQDDPSNENDANVDVPVLDPPITESNQNKIEKFKMKFNRRKEAENKESNGVNDKLQIMKTKMKVKKDSQSRIVKKELDMQKNKFKKKYIENDECIFVTYPPAKWRGVYLPKGTSIFRFDDSSVNCNFKMVRLILSDFDRSKYDNITNNDIKQILLTEYNKYYSRFSKNIISKWFRQGKSSLVSRIMKNQVTIEDCIMSEDYEFTQIDMMLLCNALNIPIVIYLQSKNQIKLITLKRFLDMEYCYLMKTPKRNKLNSILM